MGVRKGMGTKSATLQGELEEKRETNKSAAEAKSGKRRGRGTEASRSRGRDPCVRDSGRRGEKKEWG